MQVWGADPLLCPLCHGSMKLREVIESRAEVEATLAPIGLWSPARDDHHSPPPNSPPVPQIQTLDSGECVHLTSDPAHINKTRGSAFGDRSSRAARFRCLGVALLRARRSQLRSRRRL